MGIGPYTTYAPPGVYTRTINEPTGGVSTGGVRIPAIIGTSVEYISQYNYEMIRGSSSVADTQVFNENVAYRWVTGGTDDNPKFGQQNGSLTKFRVANYPIVDGNGSGTVAINSSSISVTVNGEEVPVQSVNGSYGIVSLVAPTTTTDEVLVTYYFDRKDTQITDDVSDQVTSGVASLTSSKAESYEITSGTNENLYVKVDDTTDVTIPLTAGTRSAQQIVDDINLVSATTGLSATVHSDNNNENRVKLVATSNIEILSTTNNAAFALGFTSGQYSGRNLVFTVFNGPIVDGSDGGITTTDPTKVTVTINGSTVAASEVNGSTRAVTLPYAPASGSTVKITYYFNTFQDTFDYLPNSNILTINSVGIAPDNTDYTEGNDFVIVNDGDQSYIKWGTSALVFEGTTTGTKPFNTQETINLIDDRIYMEQCSDYTDPSTNTVSLVKFSLQSIPTTGNGRDTVLDSSTYNSVSNGRIGLTTDNPGLIKAYVGKDVIDAMSRSNVTIKSVDGSNGIIELVDAIPSGSKVFVTYWYNRISDDEYTLTCTTSGASGIGKYKITDKSGNTIYTTKFGSKSGMSKDVNWPSGVESTPDAFHSGGNPVNETVTVTFDNTIYPATHATITTDPGPFDIYSTKSIFGPILVDNATVAGANLGHGSVATYIGDLVDNPGSMSFTASDYLSITVDSIDIDPIALSSATSLANVAALIDTAISNDTQTHSDGSDIFAAGTVATLVTAVNELKANYNHHVSNEDNSGGHATPANDYHNNLGTAISTADATDWATAKALIDEIATAYELHRVDTPTLHAAADNTNKLDLTLTSDTPYDAVDKLNDIISKFNSHISNDSGVSGYHTNADTFNGVITTAVFSPNNLVDSITYGSQGFLVIKSNESSGSDYYVNVKINKPSGSGQSDASAKVGLDTTREANAYDWLAVDYPAFVYGTKTPSFNIQSLVSDSLSLGIDGLSFSVPLVTGSARSIRSVVDRVNASFVGATQSSTIQLMALSSLILTLNNVKSVYNVHEASVTYHNAPGGTNPVTAANATDLATSITLVNDIKSMFNNHIVEAGIHKTDDLNSITTADATDLGSAWLLAAEIVELYSTHIVLTVYHTNPDTTDVVSVFLGQYVAEIGVHAHDNMLKLTSLTDSVESQVYIGSGLANDVLGLTQGTYSRHQPTADDIINYLDPSSNIIYPRVILGTNGKYIEINSLTTGTSSALTVNSFATSAFTDESGIGFVQGSTSDIGENATMAYNVGSSDAAHGSSGVGIPDQTYKDARTGLTFTVLKPSTGDYTNGGSFTLIVSDTATTDAAIPVKSIAGVEMTVSDTTDVALNSTAIVKTYKKSGYEPDIGDIYYISYDYEKTDMSPTLVNSTSQIQSQFGSSDTTNQLSLAGSIAMANGAELVALVQVQKSTGSESAPSTAFMAAIDELNKPIDGYNKVDVIVPMSTDTSVYSYLSRNCSVMSSPRMASERTGIIGVAAGTSESTVKALAKSIKSELITLVYPDMFIVTTVDSYGNQSDNLVDGTYAAVAVAGMSCNPQNDVATPWTRQRISGFKGIGRYIDQVTANSIAATGITVIEDSSSGMIIRHGLTTDVTTILTRTPTVITTKHFVQIKLRETLDPYIGLKLDGSLLSSVDRSVRDLFEYLMSSKIVNTTETINVGIDESDPTIIMVEVIYSPVLPAEYIVATMQIKTR